MSSRPKIDPYAVIVNGDMSQASITSSVTLTPSLSMISYGFSWSGTSPVGTIQIQSSNDYKLNPDGSVANAGTWNTITFLSAGSAVSSFAVSGNTGNGMIDLFETAAYALRAVYTKGSGVGTLQAIVNAKVS